MSRKRKSTKMFRRVEPNKPFDKDIVRKAVDAANKCGLEGLRVVELGFEEDGEKDFGLLRVEPVSEENLREPVKSAILDD